jgi:hypothetical protein
MILTVSMIPHLPERNFIASESCWPSALEENKVQLLEPNKVKLGI